MSEQYGAQRVLTIIKQFRLRSWDCARLAEAQERFKKCIYLTHQKRIEEITPKMKTDCDLAYGWFLDVHLQKEKAESLDEVFDFTKTRLQDLGRHALHLCEQLAGAAPQFGLKADAFLHVSNLLELEIEENFRIHAKSPEEALTKAREYMAANPVAGSSADIAFESAIRDLQIAAQHRLCKEIETLEGLHLASRISDLAKARTCAFDTHDELRMKWNGWTVIGAPMEQSQQCEADLRAAYGFQLEGYDNEALLVCAMARAANVMSSCGVDASPLKQWVDFETNPPARGVSEEELEQVRNGVHLALSAWQDRLRSVQAEEQVRGAFIVGATQFSFVPPPPQTTVIEISVGVVNIPAETSLPALRQSWFLGHMLPANLTKSRVTEGDSASSFVLAPNDKEVLVALLELKAFDPDHLVSTDDIATRAAGGTTNGINSDNYKASVSKLRKFGLVETKTGRGGGVWLTTDGRDRATKMAA